MNKLALFSLALTLSLFVSCGKQQTEAEKKAEIERQVQQRIDAQRQADQQQQLAAREKALADQQNATPPAETPVPLMSPTSEAPTSAREVSADEDASYNTFYRKLEPHGEWRETSDYGYVWQPRAAEGSRNWRPYTNGRWVYTDAGWTWDSEEPFGWATYHYGRWTRLRNIGWVWVPGDEWAPAWVSWRKSEEYVGWAPLPPEATFDRRTGIHNWSDNYYDIGPEEYAFVPTNDFGSRRLEQNVVPAERNVTIVTQTTNVTNITYNNTTIVNQGPNYDELRGRSRLPIERLRLERETRFAGDNPRAVVRGEVIAIPAPVIGPAQRRGRPARIKETIKETVVERGSTSSANQPAREKARAKMRAEATPPAGLPPKKFVKPAATTQPTGSASVAPKTAAPVPVPRAATPPKPTPTASPPAVSSSPSQRGLAEQKQQMEAQKEAQQAQERQQKIAAQRKLIEDQKAEKEKLHAAQKLADEQKQKQRQAEEQRKRLEQKAAEQKKKEDLGTAKKPGQPPAPMPITSASPKSTAPPVRVATPSPVVTPQTTPPAPMMTPSLPPVQATKPRPSASAQLSPVTAPSATASPSVTPQPGKNLKGRDKKKNKRGEINAATSPAVGASPSPSPR